MVLPSNTREVYSAGRGINSGLRSSIVNVLAFTQALALDLKENDVIELVAYVLSSRSLLCDHYR